ncbi:MAG: ABC transporter ATP-binding protein [Clostridiales bacterium]|nr:ABC transporter ATP-binding protein [Clostridiales bacterium]
MTVNVVNYTKILKKNTVLDDVNCTFQSGRIYGFCGKNGCGKTMLLRAIAGLILPTSGYVCIDDKIIGKDIEFPNSIGLIIENMNMIGEYTAFQNLKLLAKIKKVATDKDIKNALLAVGLDYNDKKTVKKFSLGMKQKLNIAQSIMEHPKMILLDEPTNALDDESVKGIRKTLLKLKAQDCLIIIASHNKEDIDVLCDEIIEISNGRIKQ